MIDIQRLRQLAGRPDRLSYLIMGALFILTVWLHIGSLLVAACFSHLALHLLTFGSQTRRAKFIAVLLFIGFLAVVSVVTVHFTRHTYRTFPQIAEQAIPKMQEWAKKYDVELPFENYPTLRETAIDSLKEKTHYVGSFAKVAIEISYQLLYVIAGIVAGMSLFLNSRFELGREPKTPSNNLYSLTGLQLAARFSTFYQSFATVIGAQILISTINTILTGVFVAVVGLPHGLVIVGVTFFCGLLPVIGNLISNTVIVSIGFTVSPEMAFTALIYLVVIHKLEYFLNSKIIGNRIRNPIWLTLLGLIIGERLMGIPGIILAPVILNYIKRETSLIEVKIREGKTDHGPDPDPLADSGKD